MAASKLKDAGCFKEIGNRALESLEVEEGVCCCVICCAHWRAAVHAFRAAGEASYVRALEAFQQIEERNSLAGHIKVLQGQYTAAQELFLKSSTPKEALNMHRDLLNWEQALKLATHLAVEEIPYISKEYALQLEFTGQYHDALQTYERAVTKLAKACLKFFRGRRLTDCRTVPTTSSARLAWRAWSRAPATSSVA